MTTLGLLAGKGRFPFLVTEEAKKHGRRVVVVAVREAADPSLEGIVHKLEWVHPGQLSKAIKFFKAHGVKEIVMAGLVHHTNIFRLRPDLRTMRLFMRLPDRKADTILKMIADEFSKEGMMLLPSITYLTQCLAEEGPMTKRKPTRKEQEDIVFGFKMAKAIAGLDIGQTVCVKDKSVIAVEGMEGTDACIRRGGAIAQGPFVVVKVAKPRQDVRFDVPVVGMTTIETLAESGANLIAVEAKKTLLLDRQVILDLADNYGIGVVGLRQTENLL